MEYADFEYALCAVILVFSMFGMGCSLTPRQFADILKSPRPLLQIAAAQFLAAPLFAMAMAWVLRLPEGIAVGFIVVASLPGGAFSNLLTLMGRGNVPLSISATSFSTLLSLGGTVLVLRVFAGPYLPTEFEMPWLRVLLEVAAFLLAPLALGMSVQRLGPRRSVPLARRTIQISLALLAVFVLAALASGRIRPFAYGWRAPVALFLFFTASLWMGYGAALLSGDSRDDGFAMAIEVSVRNIGLGLVLNASLFPAGSASDMGESVLFVLLAYSGVSLGMALVEVYVKRNGIGVLYRANRS